MLRAAGTPMTTIAGGLRPAFGVDDRETTPI
jgi:hypothetical protein